MSTTNSVMSSEMKEEEREDEEESEEEDEDEEEEEEEEEELSSFIPLQELSTMKISANELKKLDDNGFCTVQSVAYAPLKKLQKIKGFSEAKCIKFQEAAFKLLGNSMKFITATLYLEQRRKMVKITTGSTKLDELLGGGIETGSITELYGEFRTGKTQICHMLCVTCQFPVSNGGGEGCALYIDTEGTFRPNRIVQFVDRWGMKPEDVLDNVSFARAYNTDHQMKLLSTMERMLTVSKHSLIVVDSATALFRSEYVGRAELASRQQRLGQFLHGLLHLCDVFGVAVVITNQVVSNPDGMAFTSNLKPIGGNIIAHASTTRISLRKGRENARIAKIVDSPNLPESEETFYITNQGIADAS